jgi:hypothetical protein
MAEQAALKNSSIPFFSDAVGFSVREVFRSEKLGLAAKFELSVDY